MRILFVIAALVAAFVAGIFYATSGTTVSDATEMNSAIPTDRREELPRLADASHPAAESEVSAAEPAAEPRRELIGRQAPTTLAGFVRNVDGTPVARSIVGLFAPAAVNDGPESAFSAATSMDPRRLELFRVVRVWTRTDDDGHFAFEDLIAGTWIVRAEEGPLLAAATLPLLVRDGESRLDLVIELPPAARLEGHAIFPPSTRLDDWCLELRPNSPRSIAPWMHTLVDPVVCIRERMDESGHFRLGPVEPGLYTVGIVVDRSLAKGGRIDPLVGSVSPIIDVYLGPGTTKRDIDLTKGIPGVIELYVDLGGFVPTAARAPSRFSTAPRVRARLKPLFETQGKSLGTFEVKTDGATDLGPLVPGSWRITVDFPGESLWSWPLDRAIQVGPGERVRFDARIPIQGAAIEFLDAKSGEPFDGIVQIGRETEDGFASFGYVPARTGQLWLVLPPGNYVASGRDGSLEDSSLDPSSHARFEWTEAGPTVKSLRVPR